MTMTSDVKLTGKNAKIAQAMLAKVSQLLRDMQITSWLDSGTLLGIVRENRLLPWDNDVDISVTSADAARLIQQLDSLEKAGFVVEVCYTKESPEPLLEGLPRIIKVYNKRFFFFRGPILLDIFVQHRVGDRYCWVCRPKRKTTIYSVPVAFFDELAELAFDGQIYRCPKDTDGYLTYRYGNWRVPRQDWDITKDDNALRKNP
ncbi:LicD family protein [Permianibacter fluminis]|uniref:LicD family protein n=1 Tax=Permianibacter fluminis TaxID=2738515 RepID=UPI002E2BBD5C|nr:LicD family protein [Permianibacter fluminis]